MASESVRALNRRFERRLKTVALVLRRNMSFEAVAERPLQASTRIIDRLLPYPRHCRHASFSLSIRKALEEETKRIKGSRLPMCMYPSCQNTDPHDGLECHHIHPKRYEGQGSLQNAILFCPVHHGWADRLLISPDDCLDFKEGKGLDESLRSHSLDDLWDRFITLSEFASAYVPLSPEARWARLKHLMHAAQTHRHRDKPLAIVICAWILSEIAGFLTAQIPSRTRKEPTENHPRNLVEEYLRESRHFNDYVHDQFLSRRNEHIEAVNRTALLEFPRSAAILDDLYKNYALHPDDTPGSWMPINHVRYQSYVTRQCAVVLAKCGDRSSLTIAANAVNDAMKREQQIPESERNEAKIRRLQVAVLLAELGKANEFAASITSMSAADRGIREVIRLKTLAGWSLARADRNDAEHFIKRAKAIAEAEQLEHQLQKLQDLERFAEESTLVGHSVRGEIPARLRQIL
jgi:hypothetical protein